MLLSYSEKNLYGAPSQCHVLRMVLYKDVQNIAEVADSTGKAGDTFACRRGAPLSVICLSCILNVIQDAIDPGGLERSSVLLLLIVFC